MTFNIGNGASPISKGEIPINSSVETQTVEKKVSDSQNLEQIEKSQIVNREEEKRGGISSLTNEQKSQIKDWIERMNRVVKENVKFNFNEKLGRIYVTVVDSNTHEVIRTIPSEDALKLSAVWKEAIGNIFDKKG